MYSVIITFVRFNSYDFVTRAILNKINKLLIFSTFYFYIQNSDDRM